MRKAFNFYRSYYDVAKELNTKDRNDFIWAILQRQFEGIEPDLKNLAKFAYISQQHSIDAQVAGYETKTKTKLTPTQGGTQGGSKGGSVQGKEKGKEKGKVQFSVFWDLYDKKVGSKDKCIVKWNNLKLEEQQKILDTLPDFKSSVRDIQYLPFPETYLNQKRWNDEILNPTKHPYTELQFKTAKMHKETGYALPSWFDSKYEHLL